MYRQGVAIVITNDRNQVLVFKRTRTSAMYGMKHLWQCPQGAIEQNEDLETAMRRELQEETGITSVEVLKNLDTKTKYRFGEGLGKEYYGGKYEGQEHVWFLVKFTGDESEIDFETHPEEIEFSDYKWIDPKEVENLVVDFKKECYRQVMKEFFNV